MSFRQGAPILVQLLLVLHLLPAAGIGMPPVGAAIVAPAFSTAALQSGIHRAGLAEIPVGEITHPGFRA